MDSPKIATSVVVIGGASITEHIRQAYPLTKRIEVDDVTSDRLLGPGDPDVLFVSESVLPQVLDEIGSDWKAHVSVAVITSSGEPRIERDSYIRETETPPAVDWSVQNEEMLQEETVRYNIQQMGYLTRAKRECLMIGALLEQKSNGDSGKVDRALNRSIKRSKRTLEQIDNDRLKWHAFFPEEEVGELVLPTATHE